MREREREREQNKERDVVDVQMRLNCCVREDEKEIERI